MWKIYREIRDTNWEEQESLKHGRRPAKPRSPGRAGDRSPSPVHRVLTSIKRHGMDSTHGRTSPTGTQDLGATNVVPTLSIENDEVLGGAESDDDLDQGSRSVRAEMRKLRRELYQEKIETARNAPEPGKANLGHEEFKEQCAKETDLGKAYPSQLILTKIGDEASRKGNASVNLSHQGITAKLGEALGACMKVNTFILELDLKDNVLGALGVSALCKCLGTNYYLKKLDLSENNCGPPTQLVNPITNEVELRPGASEEICNLLRESGSITELSIANNKLEDSDLADIVEVVGEAGYVVKLDLSRNSGDVLMGEAVKTMVASADSVVEILDVSWNKLKHKGAHAIAEGMKENKVLKTLNISWNSIGEEAGKTFGNVIATDGILEHLDLGNCSLNTPSMTALAQGLEVNKALHKLILDNNRLGLYAGKALLRAIIMQDKTKVADFHKCVLVEDELVLSEVEQNLTGHYTLNLKLPPLADGTEHPHRLIAQRLAEGAMDTDGNAWRNEMLNAQPFCFPWSCKHFVSEDPKKHQKWPIPEPGKKDAKDKPLCLELDYVSSQMPGEDEESIEMFIFDHVLHILGNIPADTSRIALVRMLSLACFFRCQQVERIIELFPYREERVNVAIYFYNRVVDHGEYMDMLISTLGNEQMQDVARRLGPAKVFNEEEPDGHYRLILNKKEDRDLFVHLIELAAGDTDPNVDKCCFQVRLNACTKRMVPGEDGVVQAMDIFEDKIEDPDGLGAPPEEPEPLPEGAPPPPPVIKSEGEDDLPFKIPESGILEFDYVGA